MPHDVEDETTVNESYSVHLALAGLQPLVDVPGVRRGLPAGDSRSNRSPIVSYGNMVLTSF
jgi:hypothetical protein